MIHTLMMIGTTSVMDSVRHSIVSDLLPGIISASTTLGAVICSIAIVLAVKEYLERKSSLTMLLLRPIVTLALVCQFQSLVLNPLDGITSVFTRNISAGVKVSSENYVRRWVGSAAKLSEIARQDTEDIFRMEIEDASGKTGLSKWISVAGLSAKRVIRKRLDMAACSVGTIFAGGLFILSKVILFGQQITSGLLLSLLSVVGPIVFALSGLRVFSSGISGWIARYIQISLWTPVGFMVMKANLSVGESFVALASGSGAGLSLEWLMIVVQSCQLLLVMSVPKICSWIVSSSGSGGAHSPISSAARQAATVAVLK